MNDDLRQLVQAFLLLICIMIAVGTGLLIYFEEPMPPEMIHVESRK